jgi:hypothetical protein
MRSVGIFALFTLLLCGSVTAQSAPPLAQWTIYQVSGVAQGTWSTWYAQGSFPIKVRFKCSNGAVIVNAKNTDTLTQGVTVQYWDVEADRATLEEAIASGKALQNAGFSLPAGQSILQPVVRPQFCSAASNAFVFGAIYR